MAYKIFEGSAIGCKNILKNLNSQDYLDYKILENGIIAAVADGHSGDFFEYSDIGSKLACMCCIEILEKLSYESKKNILVRLQKGEVQKNIQNRWIELVQENYKINKPVVFKTQYLKYSTTLISTLITENFILYLKIGDGNIIVKENEEFKNIIQTKQKKIVDSLGRENSYENIMYYLEDRSNLNSKQIILFTDGYENSFKNEQDLYKSLNITINNYNQNVFSNMILNKGYNSYLSKLSKKGCHDDISIIFIL